MGSTIKHFMAKTLVIVESPTKAKTISRFLGPQYIVESSFGHVRDLPKSKMGIDLEHGTFEPQYTVSRDKAAHVKKLKALGKAADDIIFATDEDREGEAISWHLAHIFDIDPEKAKRIVFHEITEHAITEALKNPRHIDLRLVDAQQARRILDRLVGYELSPFLWKKVARGLSAGRVQSVAVRLVVEREREIQAFKPEEYWTLNGIFTEQKQGAEIHAELNAIDEKKLDKFDLNTKEKVDAVLKHLGQTKYTITAVEKKSAKRTPPPPFTTSTLQQVSNQKLKYSSKQTMRLAQQLYEGIALGSGGQVGLITYMRTDSNFLSEKFLTETKDFVHTQYGEKFSHGSTRIYKTKSKGAQEAHEAIRPTDPTRTPESIAAHVTPQQLKLYTLIWKRAVATQMADAILDRTAIDITSGTKPTYNFRANGQTVVFAGWLTLYPEFQKEEVLPEVKEKDVVDCTELKPEQHYTEPPARYSDATLVKVMEEYGIGRPSTYAPTIGTIEARQYVERDDNKRLKPTDIAFLVNALLVEHFQNIVDYGFTAQMEENLDEIAEGTKDWKPIIATFYEPFHENILKKTDELEKATLTGARDIGIDPASGKPISVRLGRFGPFVQKGTKDDEEKPTFASLKKGQSMETITLEDAIELFKLPRDLGITLDEKSITANVGRFGPYIKVGSKYYSLKVDDPYTVTHARALEVIQEAIDKEAASLIKSFPNSDIVVKIGRYGPYITDGKKNAKIPKGTEPKDLDFETCKTLIDAAPEKRGGFGRGKKFAKKDSKENPPPAKGGQGKADQPRAEKPRKKSSKKKTSKKKIQVE